MEVYSAALASPKAPPFVDGGTGGLNNAPIYPVPSGEALPRSQALGGKLTGTRRQAANIGSRFARAS